MTCLAHKTDLFLNGLSQTVSSEMLIKIVNIFLKNAFESIVCKMLHSGLRGLRVGIGQSLGVFVFIEYTMGIFPCLHDDVLRWKPFPYYWPFVRGIQWSLVESPHKGPIMQALRYLCCVGPHKLFNKQLNVRWFETTWRSCDVIVMSLMLHHVW